MSAWPLEYSQYLERLVMGGETSLPALKAEMESRFGQNFCQPTISRRLRRMGIQIYRSYPMKARFFELCRQHPEAQNLTHEEKIAIWTRFDSKQRAAIKKAGEAKTKAAA